MTLIEELCINAITISIGNQDTGYVRKLIKNCFLISEDFCNLPLIPKLQAILVGLNLEERVL